jgi:hypothetical protein
VPGWRAAGGGILPDRTAVVSKERGVGPSLAPGMKSRLAPGKRRSDGGVLHPDDSCRTAGYATGMSGGMGGGRREIPPYPD